MKKTLTINLGGTVFHIDEDAYCLLDKYLSNLRSYFNREEGAEEIVTDIESRISELFLEKINAGFQVITIEDVEEIINRIGKPEEMSSTDEKEQSSTENTRQGYYTQPKDSEGPRKFYRDPDNKVLGGVAGGLAAYMNWDPTIVRLVLFVLFLLSKGTFTIIYIICWIIIPQAYTAAEKLSMRGKKVTVENIGKTVTDGFEKVTDGINNYVNSGRPRSVIQKLGDVLVQVIGLVLKIILVIIAIACSPVLFVLIVCFIAFIIAAIGLTLGSGAALYHLLPSVDWSLFSIAPIAVIVFCIAGILLIGIPLLAITHAIFSQLFNWNPMASGLKWSLLVFWIISLVVCMTIIWNTGLAIPDYIHSFKILEI